MAAVPLAGHSMSNSTLMTADGHVISPQALQLVRHFVFVHSSIVCVFVSYRANGTVKHERERSDGYKNNRNNQILIQTEYIIEKHSKNYKRCTINITATKVVQNKKLLVLQFLWWGIFYASCFFYL